MANLFFKRFDCAVDPSKRTNNVLTHKKIFTLFIPLLIATLPWNGLSDRFTNTTYFFLILFAFLLFLQYGHEYKLGHIHNLIIIIIFCTVIATITGTEKLTKINYLQNSIFSSTKYIGDQENIYNPLIDFIPAIKWIFALVTLPYIVQILRAKNQKFLKKCIYAWVIGTVANCIVQVIQFTGIIAVSTSSYKSEQIDGSRFPGLSSHPNALAITICLTLPLVFFPILKMSNIFKTLFLILFFTSILMTGSRAGIIVFFCTILLIITRNQKNNSFRFLPIALVSFFTLLLILSGIFELVIENTRLSTGDFSAKNSNSARYLLLEFGWKVFLDYPIAGAGGALIKTSHNIYLQLLSSVGLMGFLSYSLFNWKLIRSNQFSSFIEKLPLIVFLLFGSLNNSLSDFYLYFPLGFAYVLLSKNNSGIKSSDYK